MRCSKQAGRSARKGEQAESKGTPEQTGIGVGALLGGHPEVAGARVKDDIEVLQRKNKKQKTKSDK